ncbi:hypothetical protein JZO70_00905 [Enterococcus sp. 669A]|uniref:Uncharacterized protein n=1 Tax=Candidatus Enterococcus moelleringii TaxID=2815325 RepID=A0ABS3L518_9ENTE|nr:hypothetical protein [Enterococcus sp. 669A]MBO1304702.1 hypothetical protein [Enterococcus sp. 669A]
MNSETFEELELYVQTLAFQVEGLRKQYTDAKAQQSLQQLEKDYHRCKEMYDQEVSKMKKHEPKKVLEEW